MKMFVKRDGRGDGDGDGERPTINADLGVRYTTQVSRLNVGLVLAIAVTFGRAASHDDIRELLQIELS